MKDSIPRSSDDYRLPTGEFVRVETPQYSVFGRFNREADGWIYLDDVLTKVMTRGEYLIAPASRIPMMGARLEKITEEQFDSVRYHPWHPFLERYVHVNSAAGGQTGRLVDITNSAITLNPFIISAEAPEVEEDLPILLDKVNLVAPISQERYHEQINRALAAYRKERAEAETQ